jgi:hypothetical protein
MAARLGTGDQLAIEAARFDASVANERETCQLRAREGHEAKELQ